DPYVVSIEEGADNSLLITNDNGELEWATIEDIVQDAETVTRIEEEDGIYTYYNEEDTPFVIDIPSSVVENFEEVYNQIVNEEIVVDGDTYNSFEEYLTQVINNATAFADNDFIEVSGDGSATDPYKITIVEGDANSMLITNDTGELEWATIEDIVQDAETVTVLEDNGDGTFTYTNEDGDDVTFDANTTSIAVVDGVYTFTDVNGDVITTIDTNADA